METYQKQFKIFPQQEPQLTEIYQQFTFAAAAYVN